MGDREYLKSKIIQNQQLPSMGIQVKNLGKSIIANLKSVGGGNSLRVSVEEANRRLAICKSCPKYITESSRCSSCGCFLGTKTTLTAEHCPMQKW